MRHVHRAFPRADTKHGGPFTHWLRAVDNLMLLALLQLGDETVADRAGVEPGWAEFIEENVARCQRQQPLLPGIADRALGRQQRTRAELERDRAEFGVIDPVLPLLQPPHATGHDDRHLVQTERAHKLTERQHAGIRVLRLVRILAVRQAIMAPRQPRILIHNAAQKLGRLGIRPLPQRVERARRRYDRVIVHAKPRRDLRQAVWHASPAGDAVNQPPRTLEHTGQHTLGPAHFPQQIGMDATAAARDIICPLRLSNTAADAVLYQLLVPLPPGAAVVDLVDRIANLVVIVGVDGAECTGPARLRPPAGAYARGYADAFAALNQRQHIDTTHSDRIYVFHRTPCFAAHTLRAGAACATPALNI